MIPDWVASTVTQVLEQNMLYGTGRSAHVFNHTDAGKTGTTDDYTDAWFSGYTPRLMATVWIGYPTGKIPMLSVHGITVSGPTFPAEIWHLYMDTAIGKRPDVPFRPARTPPEWVSVARPVGVLRLVHELDDNGHDDDDGYDARSGDDRADDRSSADDGRADDGSASAAHDVGGAAGPAADDRGRHDDRAVAVR